MTSPRQDDPRTGRLSPWERFARAAIVSRVLVILVGVPLVVIAARAGGPVFRGLMALVLGLGLREFALMMRARGYRPDPVLMIVSGLGVAWAGVDAPQHLPLVLTALILVAAIFELTRSDGGHHIASVSVIVFGALYIGWLGSFIVQLRDMTEPTGLGFDPGLRAVALLVAITWTCDTAAYVVGVAVGRRPLHARISPKKSLEGAVGGTLCAGAAGWAASATFFPLLSPAQGVVLGLAGAVLAQVGDLVESLLKRDAGIKDAGGLLAGHGGVLDRIDSLLFTAPLIYFVVVGLGAGSGAP